MKKAILLLLTVASLMSCMTFFASANADDYGIQPFYSNVNSATLDFVITDSGLAGVSVIYTGIQGVTTSVRCEIYIQKKNLGLFWNKVDIGITDNVWVDTSNKFHDNFSHTHQLSSTGTYRAVFKVTFNGTGGSPDVVEDKIERKY